MEPEKQKKTQEGIKVKVKSNHPLAEIIAKKLFGITLVNAEEQKRMVRRAIKAAVKFYDEKLQEVGG